MSIYIGNELELFKHAKNWKNYYSKKIMKYIYGNVLEVGAGIGETTKILYNKQVSSWLCLEPDQSLSEKINYKIMSSYLNPDIKVKTTTIQEISDSEQFDCILYIDVLEHIKDDEQEINKATELLKNNGSLIILAPAHNFLFSEFDKSIGHYRRYNKRNIKNIISPGLHITKLFYLDSVGFSVSLLNKIILKQQLPSIKQIKFWDKMVIPISKMVDIISFYSFGKSIVLVCQNMKNYI